MSLFHPITVACPFCDQVVTVSAVGSVNADRRPDFRDAILDDNFQDTTCDNCQKSFRLQPEFNYLDVGRGHWIVAMSAPGFPDYLAAEDEVSALFARSYGDKAPAAAQAIGKGLSVRVTFGWPGIREKILARGHDLDDVVLEMMKLDMLRVLPSAPLAPGIELRLVGIQGENMSFVWLETLSETLLEEFIVPLGWYQGIASAPEPWAATRAKLENGPFVDMQKLYMGEGRTVSAKA